MRRRSRRWRALAVAGAAPARGGCVRAPEVLDSTLLRTTRRASVQMIRVRFCLEAAGPHSGSVRHFSNGFLVFLLLLSYVVWPRHMMVRRATSARGGVPGPVTFRWGGAAGSGASLGELPRDMASRAQCRRARDASACAVRA